MKRQIISVSLAIALIFGLICTPIVNADKTPDNINDIIDSSSNLIDKDVLTNKDSDNSQDVSADSYDEEIFADATVNVYMLNMRCGSGTNYSIVHVLNKGDKVKVFGKFNEWYIVQDVKSGIVGCVSAYYVTLTSQNDYNDSNETINTENEVEKVLKLVNDIRVQNGLKPLILNAELSRVAEHKAMDMVSNNYFDHNSPVYGTPFEMMKKYGINFNMAAENIAGNQSAEGAVYSWTNSEGHLSNIINGDYTATGIGIYTSPVYGKIYVQLFAD